MLLLCTPNSLYSRIIRVVAIELGVDLPSEYVGVRNTADKLLVFNPAGKVPTLLLDDESVLAESRPICEYLERSSERKLLAEVSDVNGRQLEGIVNGFVDGVAVWVREARRKPEDRSSEILELEESRAKRCLQYFEQIDLSSSTLSFALISLFSALELMTMRVHSSWVDDLPKLADWYSNVGQMRAFRSTRPETTPP